MRATREEVRRQRGAAVRKFRETGPSLWEAFWQRAVAAKPEGYKAVSSCVCDTTVLLETYTTEELRIIREFLCAVFAGAVEPGVIAHIAAYLDHLDEELRYRDLDQEVFVNE